MARRVAVIGAGNAGLTCIKCCLDEGLEPVCFERSDDIGGLWRFKETLEAECASIYRSLVVNTSKEMMCFSDFPMPAHYPNYMPHTLLLQYFRQYAEHFDLLKHIHFQTKVISVKPHIEFSSSGQWEVITENRDGRKETQVFDGVLICSGHFSHPVTPLTAFPGIDSFPGKYIHSWEYKDPESFRGQRVVVIGIGNSGVDIAVDISRAAEKTFLSTRVGGWVVGRMAGSGLPLDIMINRRSLYMLLQLLPRALLNWVVERTYNQKYDHRLYALQPNYRILDRRPIINDDLPGRIIQGAVQIKPNIQEFRGSTVVFDNGVIEEGIDAVVFCTGYKATFPYLSPSIYSGPEVGMGLFKKVFPLNLERPTLAIIGLLNATGPLMPVAEMQARWATRVIAGWNHLPSLTTMQKTIGKEMKSKMKRYGSIKKAALEVEYIPYMDSIAQEVGVRPNLLYLFLTDPGLGWRVLFGPCTPFQYRLHGPGRWAGARQAIYTQWERVFQPMKTRPIPEPKTSGLFFWSLTGGAALIFALIVLHKRSRFPSEWGWIYRLPHHFHMVLH